MNRMCVFSGTVTKSLLFSKFSICITGSSSNAALFCKASVIVSRRTVRQTPDQICGTQQYSALRMFSKLPVICNTRNHQSIHSSQDGQWLQQSQAWHVKQEQRTRVKFPKQQQLERQEKRRQQPVDRSPSQHPHIHTNTSCGPR